MNKYHVSIVDSDLYKFTMQMAICKLYPRARARYEFKNRDNRAFPDGFDVRLREIIDSFRGLRLTAEDKEFMLEKCYYLDPQYLDYLSGYQYDPKEVCILQEGPKLSVTIEGAWYRAVLWEVPLMATISELYFEMLDLPINDYVTREVTNRRKAKELNDLGAYYSEFGTRRRHSFEVQSQCVGDLRGDKRGGSMCLLGTSNIYLAKLHDLTPMGTLAHEWYSGHAAMFGYLRGNIEASEAWVRVYEGNLGIALPDTFTTEAFYKHSFNTKYAKLFDGVRQDSGDPKEFIDKTVAHYKKLRIKPCLKTALFSDNLNSIEKIKEIKEYCWKGRDPDDRLIDRYGVGTWLSNEVGVRPLNMVIKLVGLDAGNGWVNTIKLSDSPTKHTGNQQDIDMCLKTLA